MINCKCKPTEFRAYWMNDNHTFVRLWGPTPKHMAQFARLLSERPKHGSGMLCGGYLINAQGHDVRNVGKDVHRKKKDVMARPVIYEPLDVSLWLDHVEADQDIRDLMKLDLFEEDLLRLMPLDKMRLWETQEIKLKVILEAMSSGKSLYAMNAPNAIGYAFVMDKEGEIHRGEYLHHEPMLPTALEYDGIFHRHRKTVEDCISAEYVPCHQTLEQLVECNGYDWEVIEGIPWTIEKR